MTRQLSEARAAVENNRIALEHSKAYLESILANLTAGVFVFDRQFRLTTANRGAERIFRQQFQAALNRPLEQIGVLERIRRDGAQGVRRSRGGDAAATVATIAATGSSSLRCGAGRNRAAYLARARRASAVRHRKRCGRRADDRLRRGVRRHHRARLGAARRGLERSGAPPRARDQEPADADPALGRAPADEARATSSTPPTQRCSSVGARPSSTRSQAMKRLVNEFRDYARLPRRASSCDLQLNDLVGEVLACTASRKARARSARRSRGPLPAISGDAHADCARSSTTWCRTRRTRWPTRRRRACCIEHADSRHADDAGRGRGRGAADGVDNGPGFSERMLTARLRALRHDQGQGHGAGPGGGQENRRRARRAHRHSQSHRRRAM